MKFYIILISFVRSFRRLLNPIFYLNKTFIMEFTKFYNIKNFDKCLDLGVGTNPYERIIKKSFKLSRYFSLDLYPSTHTSVVGDVIASPFKSKSFDLIVSFDVIQHIPNYTRMISEANRLLKSNGQIIITFPFIYPECDVRDFRRWTIDGMKSLLNDNGFEIIFSRRRGGFIFSFLCNVNWLIQHIFPGQRKSWRSKKNFLSLFKNFIIFILTFPIQIFGFIAIYFDKLFNMHGIYMGGFIVAKKKRNKT